MNIYFPIFDSRESKSKELGYSAIAAEEHDCLRRASD